MKKETDFDKKLNNLNKKSHLKKTKHVLVENQLNELSKEVKAISTKRLTKDSINKYNILKVSEYLFFLKSKNTRFIK